MNKYELKRKADSVSLAKYYASSPKSPDGIWADEANEVVITDVTEDWNDMKRKRLALFAECDYLFYVDSPASSDVKAAWATYRQALRDLPDQEGFDLGSFEWPAKP